MFDRTERPQRPSARWLWVPLLALGHACGDDLQPITSGSAAPSEPCTADVRPASDIPSSTETCPGGRCPVRAGTYAGSIIFEGFDYLLEGPVFIGTGSTGCTGRLQIAPGTTVFGAPDSFLAVQRNSSVDAEGTAEAPIRFTSSRDNPTPGSWGGVIIAGNDSGNCDSRSDPNCFGIAGPLFLPPDDNLNTSLSSGVMRFTEIHYAGQQINSAVPAALSLEGVNQSTSIDHVHVRNALRDGVVLSGGTVDIRYLLLTGAVEDALEWQFGWRGRIQFLLAQQHSTGADDGIEGSNNLLSPNAEPRSGPVLSNVTLIGSTSTLTDSGLYLRDGTGGQLWNTAVVGFRNVGIDVDDDETFDNAQTVPGALVLAHSILANDRNAARGPASTLIEAGVALGFINNESVSPTFDADFSRPGWFDVVAPDFSVSSTSALGQGALPLQDSFFLSVSYRGAVEPGGLDPWWQGWTTFPR